MRDLRALLSGIAKRRSLGRERVIGDGDRDDAIPTGGRDERVLVKSFYEGIEYNYRLVKALAGGR